MNGLCDGSSEGSPCSDDDDADMLADMAAVVGGCHLTAWSAIERQAGNCEATILPRSRIG